MEVLPGPDFPSGGIVIDESLTDAYAHGKGSLRIRARAEIVKLTRARDGIVVTELPYLVGPERVVGRIQELMRNDKLPQVTDVNNTSDRHTGLRIEIELRPGANAQAVLTELYRVTPLEDTFGINNVVLVDGVPTTVGLWELCNHYVEHRLEVVRAAPSSASSVPSDGSTSWRACSSPSMRSISSCRSSGRPRTRPRPATV